MKKIILYGVRNKKLRSQIVNYLSNDYQILGVSDSFFHKDIIQEEIFIKPCNINTYIYDYILICSEKQSVQAEITNKLLKLNIDENRIIVPRLLLQDDTECIPDLKREIIYKTKDNTINTIVMGLSYSLRGIDFRRFKLKSVDFSWHGLDLYYNYKLLTSFLNKSSKDNIKTILLVFPFYYLNYDMSKSLYQFSSGQILACRGFKDWHNADTVPDKKIKEYLISDQLFGKKFWRYKNWKKVSEINESEIGGEEIELPQTWKKIYNETCTENEVIMENILSLLENKRILFIIPPIFTKAIKIQDLIWFNQMKKYFLCFLQHLKQRYMFEIFDFSEEIKDHTCFYDYEHLNEKGRLQFTKILNQYL